MTTAVIESDPLAALRQRVSDLETRQAEQRTAAAKFHEEATLITAQITSALAEGNDPSKLEDARKKTLDLAARSESRADLLQTAILKARCDLEDAERGGEIDALQIALASDEGAARAFFAEYTALVRQLGDLLAAGVRLAEGHKARAERHQALTAPARPRGWNVQTSFHKHAVQFAALRDQLSREADEHAFSTNGHRLRFDVAVFGVTPR